MDKKAIFSVVGMLLAAALCVAVENPNVGSPFKARNEPTHSGQKQRMMTQPNPYGKSGNDIVTGNVGGGKHFRGVVPYGSSYYSGAYSRNRGSRSVNNFIRRSANPIAGDRNPGQVQSYYDPSRSVSSLRRPDGASGLSNPQLTGQGRKANPYVVPNTAQMVTTPQYQRPLSANNMDLEQILARREQLRQEAEEKTESAEKEQEKGFFDEVLSPDLMKQKQEDETTPALRENILRQLQTEDEKTRAEEQFNPAPDEAAVSEKPDRTQSARRTTSGRTPLQQPNAEVIKSEGRKLLGEDETFASLAAKKFEGFMDAAEAFIKDGQFYKATDAYALATVWKPKDARAYFGQSFSLFAAGEYMSSAYYLSRAFEIDPKAASKKYNLSDFVSSRDVFESRILELTTWQERSGSGELAFLLAYISYQDNKAVRAVSQIRKAKERMPDDPTVTLLKNIIDPEEVLK